MSHSQLVIGFDISDNGEHSCMTEIVVTGLMLRGGTIIKYDRR